MAFLVKTALGFIKLPTTRNNMSINKKYEQPIIVTLLMMVNFLVKVIFLKNNALGGDEPFSVYHAQMPISSIITLLSEGNNPPLYEILLHFWIKLFGISELSVRFPSLIFSCITVLFVYKIGVKHLNKRVALYASIIFILSNYHVLFAQEARVYALLGMLAAISMYLFLEILNEVKTNARTSISRNSTTKIVLLAITNTLIIYAHYFGFFILFVQLFFVIINVQLLFIYWKKLLLSTAIVTLLYLPNIIIIINRFVDSTKGTWVKPVENIGNLFDLVYLFSNNSKVVYLLVLIILIAAAWKLFYKTSGKKYLRAVFLVCIIPLFFIVGYSVFFSIPFVWKLTSTYYFSVGFPILILLLTISWNVSIKKKTSVANINYRFIIFWFVTIFFSMFTVSFRVPMFVDRYLMTAAIAFPLVLGISIDYLIQETRLKLIIHLLFIAAFIATTKQVSPNKSTVKETVAKIKDLKTNNTVVYICPDWFDLNFIYYYNRNYFKDVNEKDAKSKLHNYLHSKNIFPIKNATQINKTLKKNADKILYLDDAADFHSPNNNIKKELNNLYHLKNQYKFHQIVQIYEYELK